MEEHRRGSRGDGDIMAVMQAPRTRHAKPPPPGDPWLWEIFQNLDLGDDVRVEYILDTIVVSGTPCRWHEDVVIWLIRHLLEPSDTHGWKIAAGGGLQPLPEPAESIRPDLLIYDPSSLTSPDTWDVTPSHARLVVEVTSPSSIEIDRTHKPLSCARAGIPLYLCVDRFVTPVTVTLLSERGPEGYQHRESVFAGPGGGKLTLPEPFGVILDLATLPIP
jgi:Uma2 family endonuclease